MRKKLAILGASYLQLPLVEKANAMNIETHCFAWDNAEAICKNIATQFYPISVLEKELILEECTKIGIDGITTIATDICIPTIAFVAEKLNLKGNNSYHSSILSTNKSEMRKAFDKHNVNSPKSITSTYFDEKIIDKLQFPVIIKPTDRSGSRGVYKASSLSEVEEYITYALNESLEKKVVIEEFIEGVEVSVEVISINGNHNILTITDKVTTGAPYFVELEHHQPSLLPESIQDKIKTETLKALDALEIKNGASHPELKITSNGEVYLIEVGARMGGDFIGSDLVRLSTGFDFVKAVIDVSLCQFDATTIKHSYSKYSGVYFLCENSNRLLPYFNQTNEFEVEKKILKNDLISIKNSNDRSGYLIYQSNNKVVL